MRQRRSLKGKTVAQRFALTLVEVVASLIIIGGAVTAILVAQSVSLQQLHAGRLQMAAQHHAKELIAVWRIEEKSLEVPEDGTVKGHEEWSWSRAARRTELAGGVSATEITLEMACQDPHSRGKPWVREFVWLVRDEEP